MPMKNNLKTKRAVPGIATLLLAAVILVCAPLARSAAQEPARTRIVLVALEPDRAIPQLQSVLTTAADTIALTMQLLGTFTVSQTEPGEYASAEAYLTRAESGSVDRVVTVRAARETGRYLVQADVFDPLTGRLEFTRQEGVDSVLYLFDIVDQLVISLVGELAGRRIAFGSMQLRVTGWDASGLGGGLGVVEAPAIAGVPLAELIPADALSLSPEVPWTLAVDGVILGENVGTVDRLLAGRRHVALLQQRGTGPPVPVVQREVEITAGQIATVSLMLPVITASERARLSDLVETAEDAERAALSVGDRRRRAEGQPGATGQPTPGEGQPGATGQPTPGDAASQVVVALWEEAAAYLVGAAAYSPPLAEAAVAVRDAALAAQIRLFAVRVSREWGALTPAALRELGEMQQHADTRMADGAHPAIVSRERESLGPLSEDVFRILTLLATARTAQTDSWFPMEQRYREIAEAADLSSVAWPVWFTQDVQVLTAIYDEYRLGPDNRQLLYRILQRGGLGLVGAGLVTYGISAPIERNADDPHQHTAEVMQGSAGSAIVAGTAGIVSGMILKRRDMRAPEKLLEERLAAYFAERAALYGDLAGNRRGKIVENPPALALPLAAYAGAIIPPPEGVLLPLPVDALPADEGRVAEQRLPDGVTKIVYPPFSLDLSVMFSTGTVESGVTDTAQYGKSRVQTIGLGLYGTGPLPVSMGVGFGHGKADLSIPGVLAAYTDGQTHVADVGGPGWDGWILFGNPWRGAGLGVLTVNDSVRTGVFWLLQYRRFRFAMGRDPQYGSGTPSLVLSWAHPFDPPDYGDPLVDQTARTRLLEAQAQTIALRNSRPVRYRWTFSGAGHLGGVDAFAARAAQLHDLYPLPFETTIDSYENLMRNMALLGFEMVADWNEWISVGVGISSEFAVGTGSMAMISIDDGAEAYDLYISRNGSSTYVYTAGYFHLLERFAIRAEAGMGSFPTLVEDYSGYTDVYGGLDPRELYFYTAGLGFDVTAVRRPGFNLNLLLGMQGISTDGVSTSAVTTWHYTMGTALVFPQREREPGPGGGFSDGLSDGLGGSLNGDTGDRIAGTATTIEAGGLALFEGAVDEVSTALYVGASRETHDLIVGGGIGGLSSKYEGGDYSDGSLVAAAWLGFGRNRDSVYCGITSVLIGTGDGVRSVIIPTVWYGPFRAGWLPGGIWNGGDGGNTFTVGFRVLRFPGQTWPR